MAKMNFNAVKSSSIVETIVAMTIMLFMFLLATVLFARIIFPSASLKLISTHDLLINYARESADNKQFNNEERKEGNFTLKREKVEDLNISGLSHMHYSISDRNNKIVGDIDELVNEE